jgi:hypothetical protein
VGGAGPEGAVLRVGVRKYGSATGGCHTGVEGFPYRAVEERVLHYFHGAMAAETSLCVREEAAKRSDHGSSC